MIVSSVDGTGWVAGGTYTHAHGDLLATFLLLESFVEDDVHEDLTRGG